MADYVVTQETEDGYDTYDICTFRADLSQASCPVEIHNGKGWDATPFQVADGIHEEREIARLLMRWMGLDGECYSLKRPYRVREVTHAP